MSFRSAIARPWIRAGFDVLLCADAERVKELRGGPHLEESAKSEPSSGSRTPYTAGSGAFRPPSKTGSAYPREGENRPPVEPMPSFQGGRSAGAFSAPGERTAGRTSVLPMIENPSRRSGGASSAAFTQVRPGTPSPEVVSGKNYPADGSASGVLPFERWPDSWKALKTRRPMPESPLVMWTYAGLGDDLTGTPDENRRLVVVRMLKMLGHPGGTHVFWPYELPGDVSPEGASLFWSGAALFAPRVLLLFGSDARNALAMPRTLLPFSQERVGGRLIIQLPRPEAFVGDEAAFARAQVFLGRLLSFCRRRSG